MRVHVTYPFRTEPPWRKFRDPTLEADTGGTGGYRGHNGKDKGNGKRKNKGKVQEKELTTDQAML